MRRALAALSLLAVAALSGCTSAVDIGAPTDPPPALAPPAHPFQGATLIVDPATAAARYQARNGAPWLSAITDEPTARWVNGPDDLPALASLADTARARRELPVLVAYDIPDRSCDGFREGAPTGGFDVARPSPDSYAAFVRGMISTLGTTRSVIVLEPDATSAECYTPARAAVLREATIELERAGHFVYLDAGHTGWRSSGETATRLMDSGVQYAEGFSLNVSNRAGLPETARYGEEVAELVGGRDYVVDVGRAGAAGLDPGDWCNPPGQALGPAPSTQVRSPAAPHLAATLWIKPPGESDGNFGPQIGNCHGETTPPGTFSPVQARALIANSSTARAATTVGSAAGG